MNKILVIGAIFFQFFYCQIGFAATENKEKIIVEDKTKQLLAKVKSGNYSHIGGVDAINIVITEVTNINPELRIKQALEIGCGFGGTANYFAENGFVNLWAMDLKKDAIESASKKFPGIKFKVADATSLTDDFEDEFFSFVFLLNTAYAIPDKSVMWQKIKTVSKEDAILAVLDYTRLDRTNPEIMVKPNGNVKHPIDMEMTKRVMDYIGWEVLLEKDLTEEFKKWHQDFIEAIQNRHELLVTSGFSEAEQQFVVDYFTHIIELIENKKIGGTLMLAKKR